MTLAFGRTVPGRLRQLLLEGFGGVEGNLTNLQNICGLLGQVNSRLQHRGDGWCTGMVSLYLLCTVHTS